MIRRTFLAVFILLILSALIFHPAGARQEEGKQNSESWSQISDLQAVMADSLLQAGKLLLRDAERVRRLWDKYHKAIYNWEADPFGEELTYINEHYAMQLYQDAIVTLEWALDFDSTLIEAHYELGVRCFIAAHGLTGEQEGDPDTIRKTWYHLKRARELIEEYKQRTKSPEKNKYYEIEQDLRTYGLRD